jgi:micrococcal nuclease
MIKLVRRTFSFIFLLVVALIVYFLFIQPRINEKPGNNSEHFSVDSTLKTRTFVKKVIDGDTFIIENGSRVRMLGIDAPEMRSSGKMDSDSKRTGQDQKTISILGQKSFEYLRDLIENEYIYLVPEQNYEDKDKYDRLLRYVYLEDDTFVNGKMVADGYAQVYRKFDLTKKNDLIAMENDARRNKRGLWDSIEGTKQFE